MPESQIPTIKDKSKVLYYVTIFEFPHATVRYQVPEGITMVEQVTTFDRWIELEAQRCAKKTGMSFGCVPNNHGQIALAALKGEIALAALKGEIALAALKGEIALTVEKRR